MVVPPVQFVIVWLAVAVGTLAVFVALMVIGCQHCRGAWRADRE